MIQPRPTIDDVSTAREHDDYLPARMVNELVYCPRLFYFMHVEGQFAHNAETTDGISKHRRVDTEPDALPRPDEETTEPASASTTSAQALSTPPTIRQLSLLGENDDVGAATTPSETPHDLVETALSKPPIVIEAAKEIPSDPIHARSVTLASDRYRVLAKLDLVEARGSLATPVDYKRGEPRRGVDGMPEAWDCDRVQICLQAIVLRENGFQCNEGVLYFASTRQRVTVVIDDALIAQTLEAVQKARQVTQLPRPPLPLVDSPKCVRCSLSPICLPDETNRCRARQAASPTPTPKQMRLPLTPRDDHKALYLNTQGLQVGKRDEVLRISVQGKLVEEVRIRDINHVCLFGNVQISSQAMHTLCQLEVPIVFFSQRGYFYGMVQGTGLKNILLRREQFRRAEDPTFSLALAKSLVAGKIRNQRVLLMRNHVAPPPGPIAHMKEFAGDVGGAHSEETLLGIEGNAARIYFQHFAGMLKPGDGAAIPAAALSGPPQWPFDFRGRNRRPPRDPINAMLSFGYSLLTKDVTVACAAVGLDPYLGYYHHVRPGKPALALDLMEPFRPLIVDSTVLSAVNTRMVNPECFVPNGDSVMMTASGRAAFLRAYEQRMDTLVTHPMFEYRVSYRRLLEIQTRLLARVITGELIEYPTFVTR
jgi:CRISP-associated protein Cas1